MSSARVLSTAELGAIRYAQADDAQKFPVEFKYKNGSQRASQPDVSLFSVTVQSSSNQASSESSALERTAGGEWCAVLNLAPGPLTYAIARDGAEVAAGGLEVVPPEAPLGNTRHAAKLSTQTPSGAKQRGEVSATRKPGSNDDANAPWDVEFIYGEEAWSVREVWVEVVDHDPVAMKPVFGQDSFSVTVPLPAGVARFRFRVVLREPCRPDAAPFTRLGWDPRASTSKGLATWELSVTVNDLQNGVPAGTAIMNHEKKIKNVPMQVKGKSVPGDTIVSGVSVKSAAAKIDTPPSDITESPKVMPSSNSSEDVSDASAAARDSGAHAAGSGGHDDPVHDSSALIGRQRASSSRPGGLWLAVVPVIGIGLIAILAAFVGHRNEACDVVVEDDGSKSSSSQTSPRFGYLRHAISQGL
jgi:hypothetical protein